MSNALGTELNDMGLDALLQDIETPQETTNHLPLSSIYPSHNQPRTQFDEAALNQLSASIRQHGVLQPIAVMSSDKGYQIIAGERRYRAAKLAGFQTIPAVIHSVNDAQRATLALIENMVREDLSVIEKAEAFKAILEQQQISQQGLADQLNISRSSLSNCLRLLELDPIIQAWVQEGTLTMGHARALLTAKSDQRLALAHQIIERGLSVRATEALVQPKTVATPPATSRRTSETLSRRFAMPVTIIPGKKTSKLVIEYQHLDVCLSQLGLTGQDQQAILAEIDSPPTK